MALTRFIRPFHSLSSSVVCQQDKWSAVSRQSCQIPGYQDKKVADALIKPAYHFRTDFLTPIAESETKNTLSGFE